jgi:hypothetical protein
VACDPAVRSRVLAAFYTRWYEHGKSEVVVEDNNFHQTARELGLHDVPHHQLSRALNSLAHNTDKKLQRLDKNPDQWAKVFYVLKEDPDRTLTTPRVAIP